MGVAEGLRIIVPRSKTDQERRGHRACRPLYRPAACNGSSDPEGAEMMNLIDELLRMIDAHMMPGTIMIVMVVVLGVAIVFIEDFIKYTTGVICRAIVRRGMQRR
jgi:hypothetical protein